MKRHKLNHISIHVVIAYSLLKPKLLITLHVSMYVWCIHRTCAGCAGMILAAILPPLKIEGASLVAIFSIIVGQLSETALEIFRTVCNGPMNPSITPQESVYHNCIQLKWFKIQNLVGIQAVWQSFVDHTSLCKGAELVLFAASL